MKVEAALGKLLPMTASAKLEQLTNATKCNPEEYDMARKEGCAAKIVDFMKFTKNIEPVIKQFR